MPRKNVSKPKEGAISSLDKADLREKELEFVKNANEKSTDKIKVKINNKTWIYISPDRDPEEARRHFIEVYGE